VRSVAGVSRRRGVLLGFGCLACQSPGPKGTVSAPQLFCVSLWKLFFSKPLTLSLSPTHKQTHAHAHNPRREIGEASLAASCNLVPARKFLATPKSTSSATAT
jgi:hypothetical protein